MVFIHTKNGVSVPCWRVMKSMVASLMSSSMVCIRFVSRGPVSSMICLPTAPNFGWSGRPKPFQWPGISVRHAAAQVRARSGTGPHGIIELLGFLLGVQVIEVAEELIEAVHIGRYLFRSPKWFLPNCPVA